MTRDQIGQLLLAVGWMAFMFWGMARYRRRRQAGDKAADFYVEEPADYSMVPPGEFVTIAQFAISLDAEMARLKLEGENIECVIYGEPAEGPGRNLLAGPGIELKVRAADAARAAESLRGMLT